jgi:hypothetical protein
MCEPKGMGKGWMGMKESSIVQVIIWKWVWRVGAEQIISYLPSTRWPYHVFNSLLLFDFSYIIISSSYIVLGAWYTKNIALHTGYAIQYTWLHLWLMHIHIHHYLSHFSRSQVPTHYTHNHKESLCMSYVHWQWELRREDRSKCLCVLTKYSIIVYLGSVGLGSHIIISLVSLSLALLVITMIILQQVVALHTPYKIQTHIVCIFYVHYKLRG